MEFVTYKIGKKLKEKGYPHGFNRFKYCIIYSDEYTIKYINYIGAYEEEYYGENIPCPTIDEVLEWFRKEHHLHFEVVSAAYGYNLIISDTPDKGGTDRYISHADHHGPNYAGAWDEYNDCVLHGIEYVLDYLI